MQRIKVTGYLNVDDLLPDDVDLDHESGLSEKGYFAQVHALYLDDLEFKLMRGEF